MWSLSSALASASRWLTPSSEMRPGLIYVSIDRIQNSIELRFVSIYVFRLKLNEQNQENCSISSASRNSGLNALLEPHIARDSKE